MAIVVEEGNGGRSSNLIAIVGWIAFLAIAAGAVYYIFFAQPELVVIPASGSLSAIAPLTQISVNPTSITQGQAFLSLHNTITAPTPQGPAPVGRPNPFVSP